MSTVYFVSSRANSREKNLTKYRRLLARLDLSRVVSEGDLVAIKVSFGEHGNMTYVRPQYARVVVDEVKRLGGRPFLTDSNTLYVGGRENARDHAIIALENGFGYEVTGAPIVIADGLLGFDYRTVPVQGEHFQEAKVASVALDADAIIALSHFKGHMVCGFGGALKNLGMGFGSRSGKRMMHSDLKPVIVQALCDSCARCIQWCPEDAITMVEGLRGKKVASIDKDKCIGCSECIATCATGSIRLEMNPPTRAVPESARYYMDKLKARVPDKTRKTIKRIIKGKVTDEAMRQQLLKVGDPSIVQQKTVEYAAASLHGKEGKFAAINFIIDVTPDCDCIGWSDNPIVPNIGITASLDPVAIDAASLDLVNQAQGNTMSALSAEDLSSDNKFGSVHKGIDPTAQLVHGHKIGFGSIEYKLVNLDRQQK
ncbi:MAG: DUF362 domain-containing protein [Thermoleophilia bacterium]